jgi:hypothetical protein
MVTKYKMNRKALQAEIRETLDNAHPSMMRREIQEIANCMLEKEIKHTTVKNTKKPKTAAQLSHMLHNAQQELELISEQLREMSRNIYCTTPDALQESLDELSLALQSKADEFSF